MLPAGKALDSTRHGSPECRRASVPHHGAASRSRWRSGGAGDAVIEGVSSKEAFERVRDLSLGLGALGMAAGDRVAILAESRPEWILSDLAVLAAGAVTVPIYPTLAASQVRYILQDSGARLAVGVDRRTARQAAGGAAPAAGARSGGRHGRSGRRKRRRS